MKIFLLSVFVLSAGFSARAAQIWGTSTGISNTIWVDDSVVQLASTEIVVVEFSAKACKVAFSNDRKTPPVIDCPPVETLKRGTPVVFTGKRQLLNFTNPNAGWFDTKSFSFSGRELIFTDESGALRTGVTFSDVR